MLLILGADLFMRLLRSHFVDEASARIDVQISAQLMERVLGMRAEFPIPTDIAVPMSVNSGTPTVDHDPNSGASRALRHIAMAMMDGEAVPMEKKTRLGRRVKRK